MDLFAPGDLVFTTSNSGGFRLVSGTSIAAPQVAAAYALYRAAWPDATAAELKQALLDDVDPVPAFAGKSVTGGRLSIGSLADGALGAVRYTFTSMTAPAGVVEPGITAAGDDASRRLLRRRRPRHGAGRRGLGGRRTRSCPLGGTTLTTDDSGEALFALGTATRSSDLTLSPSMELGDGRYVLTVQLYRDGTVLGRTFAAPLLVGTAVTAPSGSGTPGSGTGGSAAPGTGTGTGSGTGPAPAPARAPARARRSGSAAPAPGPARAPRAPARHPRHRFGRRHRLRSGRRLRWRRRGTAARPARATSATAPRPLAPARRARAPAPPARGPGRAARARRHRPGFRYRLRLGRVRLGRRTGAGRRRQRHLPGSGPFGITSMSPATVDVTGGTVVTITGTALPSTPRVRVGDSATATVLTSSPTSLTFRAPARVAGVYDVHVFAPDGTEYVLTAALTYVDGAPAAARPRHRAPRDGDRHRRLGHRDRRSGTGPGTAAPGPAVRAPARRLGLRARRLGLRERRLGLGRSGTATPVVVTGPGGKRLVRTTKFAALGGIWSMDCSSSCGGVAI